ncbi:cytidylyltransferase domain-containing protein [Clostridium novyi]|uniref:cytidylyltransferase domain-containing protein n=1 Tax=Clostridium novyi TaxID=1542 RepID=UPI00325BC0B9
MIRITGDCPVIDYSIIDKMIEEFCKLDEMKKIDYMSNFDIMKNTFPRGMDVEIIKMETLKIAYEYAEKLSEREHVTPYIYNNPNKFKLMGYINEGEDLSGYRLTLDTKEDFNLIEVIYENLYEKDNNFGLNDIINFIKSNPKVLDINKNIIQKTL